MTDKKDSRRQWIGSSIITIVIACTLVVLSVFVYQKFLSTPDVAQTASKDSTEAWPSPQPTRTPLPTVVAATPTATLVPTAIPIPTPISLPVWNKIEELGVVSFTLSTDAEAQNLSDQSGLMDWLKDRFGTDRVRIRAVGKIRVGVDLSEIKISDTQTNGETITVNLPAPKSFGVELMPENTVILEQSQRVVLSEYSGLEVEAMGKAKVQLEEMVTNNTSMMDLAKEITRLRLEARLKDFGFKHVTIKFPSES